MSKSIWTDTELDALARKLLFKYPGRGFDRVTQPHQIDLNDLELTPIIEAEMAPHRQALRPKLNRLKRDLVPALMRVTGRDVVSDQIMAATAHPQPATRKPLSPFTKPAFTTPPPEPPAQPVEPVNAPQAAPEPVPAQAVQGVEVDEEAEPAPAPAPAERPKGNKQHQTKIRWTDDEWKLCALALHTMSPQLNLIEATTERDLAGMTLRELNLAASMMQEGRRRSFKWLKGPAARLLQEYARARRERDPMYFGLQAKPADPKPAPEPKPAPAPAPEPTRATPRPAQAASSPVTFSRAGEQRIFWSAAEWVEIALEIDRLHPHSKYAERNTTGALTVTDLMQAQRVLPNDRRRQLRTANMDKLRGHLLEGFKEVRRMKAEAAAAAHAQALQVFEEKRQAAAEPPPPNPWEQALRPLVELVVQQLGNQLVPMIVQALAGQVAGSPQAPASPASHIASVTSITAAMTGLAKLDPKPKKLSVGICNNRLTFADELKREFPDIEFTFIENSNPHIAASVANCDKVILMTKWTSHTMQNRLKRDLKDRLILVNGSTSDIKRVLNGLLNSTERKTA
jgi:hypothetical protein